MANSDTAEPGKTPGTQNKDRRPHMFDGGAHQIHQLPKRALYLFAGLKRQSDVSSFLIRLGWNVTELDILRSRNHDLTKRRLANKILSKVRAGYYQAILASPPCDTFSRVKFSNLLGPQPVRDFDHLRGFPWLKRGAAACVQLANTLVDLTWEIAAA